MKRKDLEKLSTVSIRSRLYVAVDEVIAALEAEAKAEQPKPAAEKPAEKGKPS